MYWFEPTKNKNHDILFQVSSALCGIMAICQNLSFFRLNANIQEFHSSFAFFCLISLGLVRIKTTWNEWDSLLQWRDQRNTQPWIWLQMVFPHWTRIYALFSRSLTRQLHHVKVEKTANNCHTRQLPWKVDEPPLKLAEQNKTKKTTTPKRTKKYCRLCRKKKYFVCAFF